MKVNIKRPSKNGTRQNNVAIEVESHDIWNLDWTLAQIIIPCLYQLKEQKKNIPMVDLEDVPQSLKPSNKDIEQYTVDGSADEKFNDRYQFIIDEMIWAFEKIKDDQWEIDLYENNVLQDIQTFEELNQRIANGLRLFGKYYRTLWL